LSFQHIKEIHRAQTQVGIKIAYLDGMEPKKRDLKRVTGSPTLWNCVNIQAVDYLAAKIRFGKFKLIKITIGNQREENIYYFY
jgi:hypothetical protein